MPTSAANSPPLTLDEALAEVAEREGAIDEVCLPVSALRVEPGHLAAEDLQLKLGEEGLARLCRHVGAPASYVGRLDEAVQASLLQHHLTRGDLGLGSVTLISRDGELVDLASPHLLRLRGREVLAAVVDGVAPHAEDLTVHATSLRDESFEINLVSSKLTEEVGRGDVVQAGLRVTHSLTGAHATWVQAFVLRLVCANGLTYRDCVSAKAPRARRLPLDHSGARTLQLEQIQRLAAITWAGLREKLQALRALLEERVEVDRLLPRWLERARLAARGLMPRLLEAWNAEGGQPNTWSAVNTLTRVATHDPDLTPRERRTLAALAGLLAFRHIHLCPRCFSLVAGPSGVDAGREPAEC